MGQELDFTPDTKARSFSFSHAFEQPIGGDDPLDGAVHLSQSTFDAMKLLRTGDKGVTITGTQQQPGETIRDYGSVGSITLPNGFRPMAAQSDVGGDTDSAPKMFETPQHTRIGLHQEQVSAGLDAAAVKEILSKPAHSLNDDEYFKVAEMMTPGAPWSANGRGHEIDIRTAEVNGRPALVYDYWRANNLSRDGFDSKMGANDIRTRVVFVPDDKGKVDVFWFEAKSSEFDKQAKEFDQSLKSIRWR